MRKEGILADLLCGIGNLYWDLARILSAAAFVGLHLLGAYMLAKGQPVTLNDYAEAVLKLLAGCAIFIGGKDVARAYSTKDAGQ